MFGRIHGWDPYGRPDFTQTELISELPKCMHSYPSRMPIKQAPIFRQMSREGFLDAKPHIIRDGTGCIHGGVDQREGSP